MRNLLMGIMILAPMVSVLRAGTVWERVDKPYEAIQSLSCEIRRDMPVGDGGSARMLSRVYFQRGDRMHVETFSPLARRIVCDGTTFRSHMAGMARGFGAPVSQLKDDMLGNLRSVPASPEMALRQLTDTPETRLEPVADANEG